MAESAKGKWARVHSALRRRRLPSRQDIIGALRMGDPKMGPPEIQAHIAALLAGEVGARRGPRQKPFDQVLFEDEYLIRRVDRGRQEFKAKGARTAQQPGLRAGCPGVRLARWRHCQHHVPPRQTPAFLDVANTDAEIEQILRENG